MRVPRRSVWPALAITALTLTGTAQAEDALLSRLIDPKASYAADLTMTSGQVRITGRIYHTPGRTRAEFNTQGQRTVSIIDRPQRRVWMVMAASRQYMEIPLKGDVASAFLPPNVTRQQIKLTTLGNETVDGEPMDKVRVEHPMGRSVMWITGDGIVVKMDGISNMGGRETKVTMQLRNLKRGPQDAKLFKLPAGYKKIDMPGRR